MPAWVHRTTKVYLRSVPSAELPEPVANYIEDSAEAAALFAAGVPGKYWNISGDTVSEMWPAEKAAVDAAELDAARNETADQLDQLEDVLRAFALTLLDELNGHAAHINSILDAIDNANNLSALKTAIAAIPDYPTRTVVQLKTALRTKLGT